MLDDAHLRLSSPRLPRHRLALVVGSGGVHAAASLGVADVLRQAGVPIDLVVGCSAGALFGGGIAMQLPLAEAMRRYQACWQPQLTRRTRWRGWLELALPRWARFGPHFALRDARALYAAYERGFDGATFHTLPTPLRVVATDRDSGLRHVITQGSVVDAVRASTALPFLFPAVPLDGRMLCDGVLSDPLPVSVADDAAVVVAVGWHAPLPRRITRASRLAAAAGTALVNNLQAARLDAARAAGVRLVMPTVVPPARVGLFDPTAIPMLVDAGRRAALLELPRIVAALESALPPTPRARLPAAA